MGHPVQDKYKSVLRCIGVTAAGTPSLLFLPFVRVVVMVMVVVMPPTLALFGHVAGLGGRGRGVVGPHLEGRARRVGRVRGEPLARRGGAVVVGPVTCVARWKNLAA